MVKEENPVIEAVKAILAGGVAGVVVANQEPSFYADLLADLVLLVVMLALYYVIHKTAYDNWLQGSLSFASKNRQQKSTRLSDSNSDEHHLRPYSVLGELNTEKDE